MGSKLTRFFEKCMLPEIIDPRIHRSMPIREPDYILAEQERKSKKPRHKVDNEECTERKEDVVKYYGLLSYIDNLWIS